MKQERWKVTLAVIFLLVSGFWYSHLYYDGKVIQETAPAVETVEVMVNERINLNTASKEELMLLDGIGEKMAERILAYREEYGPFAKIEDIQNVKGIGEKTYAKIAGKLTVD
ncbi:ComEA family DNA-binding protein [Anaerotignum sp.]|uniref:ComEA family DNA-binding protein n=1 Tax=Anaerotignum sp. TaxID=2039241 RepID=UPI002A912245|nr:helix-hairpin-helix domain-containing protein [Anaerotignum sp.]MCI7657456.1 helix-hairpin-helix domain-containing protein [Clostridia bacterium]MDY5414552.1 helix-hairpin-helix domain-containing protein [Anaerotignum sp.]